METFGTVVVDAYRTYNTPYRIIIEGFVGSGDPTLDFLFNELEMTLCIVVRGDCRVVKMRERVKSMGHDLYLPFTKSLQKTAIILKEICRLNNIESGFRPTSYSDPESNVTGEVEVPDIIAKYGHVYMDTPSLCWDHNSLRTYHSAHSGARERLYVEWENPKEKHEKWKETIWMKNEFHIGCRCKGFKQTGEFNPIESDASLVIRIPAPEIGHLCGLMTKMVEDYTKFGSQVQQMRGHY